VSEADKSNVVRLPIRPGEAVVFDHVRREVRVEQLPPVKSIGLEREGWDIPPEAA
jgi:hypothetical protein